MPNGVQAGCRPDAAARLNGVAEKPTYHWKQQLVRFAVAVDTVSSDAIMVIVRELALYELREVFIDNANEK